jgi:hypothetical protein
MGQSIKMAAMVAALFIMVLAGCGTPARSTLHTEPNIYLWHWKSYGANRLAYAMDYAEHHPYVAAQMALAGNQYAEHAVLVAHAERLRACIVDNIHHAFTQAQPASTDHAAYARACMWAMWPVGREVPDAANN